MNYILTHPFIFLSAGFVLVALALAAAVLILYRRWNAVFGRRAHTAESTLADVARRLVEAEARISAIEPRVDTLEDIGKIAVQRVGFLRFNPFENTGSDQSFALALLDREGNGVIVSSLYTRDGARTYAKAVEHGSSKHPLSEEEQKVLEQALSHSP